MFKDIFLKELGYWLKKPATYFFCVTFFVLSFLLYAGSAGFFDPPSGEMENNEWLNSYYGINFILLYLNKPLVVLVPIIVGASIYKDFKYRIHSILYSFPIHKTTYLTSRISASLCIVFMVVVGMIICMVSVEFLPGLDPSKMGEFVPQAYLHTLLIYILPNLLLISSIVIAAVLFTRNIYVSFVASLIPFLIQAISENAFAGNNQLIALFDPFGQNTLAYYTRDWSIYERNTRPLPIAGMVLVNRIFWFSVTFLLTFFSIKSFKLHERIPSRFKGIFRKPAITTRDHSAASFSFSEVTITYAAVHHWKVLWHLSVNGFKYITKSPIFLIIVALGILSMVFAVNRVTQSGEMILMPLTKIILLVPATFYSLVSMILIFIYSGLLINRERNARISQLVDTTSAPFWVYWGSKFLALVKVVVLLLFVFMIAGMSIQLAQGYTDLEPGLYFYHLTLFMGVPLLIWIVAAFFTHTIIDNFYVALFVLVFGWIGIEGLPEIGLKSYLLRFNSPPSLSYSDINGYGSTATAFFVVEGYWMAFAALLLVGIHLLWPHGVATSIVYRLRVVRNRGSVKVILSSVMAMMLMITLGLRISAEEAKRLDLSKGIREEIFSQFEREFKKYERILSPKIRSLDAKVELYPNSQSFTARGTYAIENPWSSSIDTLLIRTGFDELSSYKLSVDHEVVMKDDFMQFSVVKLHEPLKPSEQLTLEFDIRNKANSLFERNSNVLSNGTFLKHDLFPRLGYSFKNESAHPLDSLTKFLHYQGIDSDLIDIQLTIGTSEDQLAIGPGMLVKKEEKNGRNYFVYKTSEPVKFSFGINSGSYETYTASTARIPVDIYSHHKRNHSIIETSIANTLNYMEKYFGDYRFENIRVIEFPDSEGSYSTAFANNIPMSEVRFISNANAENEKTNLSYYVPAHELIHHWWGSTLMPAAAKGASMLTESITEYLTLQVYEMQYGKTQAKNFLRLQHQRYWNGHNRTTKPEPPLYLVEPEQQFISYGKGTIVFNGLSTMVGKEKLNKMLVDFLLSYEKKPYYPTSIDFVKFLKKATADSLNTFIDSQFKRVSYFENSLQKADMERLHNGNYQVKIQVQSKKWAIDPKESKKIPSPISANDWAQTGCFDQNNQPIKTKWIKLDAESKTVTVLLQVKPSYVILDPNLLLLDKNRDNNQLFLN